MTAIHETAYPRFKSDLTQHELAEIYTPAPSELVFVRRNARSEAARLVLLTLLKTVQRLGYFVKMADVPSSILTHLADSLGGRATTQQALLQVEQSGARQRLLDIVRRRLKLQPVTGRLDALASTVSLKAAETMHEFADIINVTIEELIRQRFELLGFSTLLRTARWARGQVNDRYFDSLCAPLPEDVVRDFDALLMVADGQHSSAWQDLKQEPKKPTNNEVRAYLQRIHWLKWWALRLPAIDHIPVAKYRQYALEARALDAADLKALQATKRYALMVVLFHAQLRKSLDDAVDIFIRRLRGLHSNAEEQLKQYYVDHQKRVDKLVSQLRAMVEAYREGETDRERVVKIGAAMRAEPDQLLAECDQHMAYAGNNYLPFLLGPYQTLRPLLLNCLTLLNVASTTRDQSLVHAIAFVLEHRQSHKAWLPVADSGLSFRWLPDKWRRLVTGEGTKKAPTLVNRKYFELCVLTEAMQELQSGDLFVENSEQYSDFRTQLIDWDVYQDQVAEYGSMLDLATEPGKFVANLKRSLSETASRIDQGFPENEHVELDGAELFIRKHAKEAKPAALDHVDKQLAARLPDKNILDILVEAEGWLDLHKLFGPLSGLQAKIDDPRKRFVTTLFCYGCNLGPTQTARSVKGLSRKQIAWLNLHHTTEERLEKANVQVINAYNKFLLPKYWGSGKRASADGTKWNLYEQNLLSEYHIRYGGYGGIGYYHVSDMYIALFSHFIPCGVYEAIYILDGLIKNDSDVQPDTLHGDTQAQSAPVFGLAYLLGIKLMPRIRNLKHLVFFRPDRASRYEHINDLFTENIDWRLIETHLPDMLRIALSIRNGKITPSTILKRLGTASRKNKLYFAFRELGRVVRTSFLLEYIGDVELRKVIQSSTNKSEEFNQFIKWLFFGGEGIIAENVRHEQRKIVKYNQLVANLVILHNVESMTRTLKAFQGEGLSITEEVLAGLAPYRTEHINRFGDYTLNLGRKVPPMDYKLRII
ncbi:Tn3 family transposase [Cupriavidus sp. TMH.W2]|uniref:Tn3 family transposase n=1 Tax=Cupriavidus sp. TMH.W2 TaxID=3434465 RepID=UPI003D784D77